MDGAVVLDFWILNPECQFSKFDLIYLENYFSIFVDFEVVMTFGLLIWKPLELFHQSFLNHFRAILLLLERKNLFIALLLIGFWLWMGFSVWEFSP